MWTKEEYNDEPLHYCPACLEIRVRILEDIKLDICEECGNTEIATCHVEEWNKLYVEKHGELFLSREE